MTPAWRIARTAVDKAATGDVRFTGLVLDRVDGKVPERVQAQLLTGVTLLPGDQLDAATWRSLYAARERLSLPADAVPVLAASAQDDDSRE